MKTKYAEIVINPAAGNGRGKRIAQSILQRIKASGDFELNISFTKEKDEATSIARKAISDGASIIIAAGGDGTINEVVNGFYFQGKSINPLCELGIINCGTGGGFSKSLHSPAQIDGQIEQILNPGISVLDLGKITCRNISGGIISRLFINECQIGIGSKVAERVGKKSKIFGGTLAFGFTATILALLIKPLKLSVGFDDEAFKELKLIGLVAGNGTECAGGMKLTPDARLNDGLLDVLSINEMNIYERIRNFSRVYSGTHILSPKCTIKRCKRLQVRSEIAVSLESDGEILGISPFDIEIIPSAIRLKTGTNNPGI